MNFNKKNIFAVNKPIGPTSFDIVEEIRKITGIKKVGHGGTLDPLAEGVLVVGVGRDATKKLFEITSREKEYIVTIKFGETSRTDDKEGEKTKISEKKPTEEEVKKVVKKFIGEIDQIPPNFSAVKVQGKRAYKSARKGEKINLQPRQITIKKIEILSYNYPRLKLKVITGKGVYIRSLARDIGEELGVGGYVLKLKRTRIGDFKLEDSINLEELKNKIAGGI